MSKYRGWGIESFYVARLAATGGMRAAGERRADAPAPARLPLLSRLVWALLGATIAVTGMQIAHSVLLSPRRDLSSVARPRAAARARRAEPAVLDGLAARRGARDAMPSDGPGPAASGGPPSVAAADSTKGCATEDGLNVSEVAFGVLTSQRYVTTRLHSQQQTWLRQVRHAAFYSEAVDDTVPTIPLEPPANEELVGGGAWKNFPALIDLHKRFPAAKWVFFHDDDTYVFVSNLLRTLSKYDADANFYLGLYWTPREDMEWREVKIAYASGGAGYAISRGLMRRLAAVMPACHANYTRWAGDIRVGKCIADLGVRITPEVGFHHEG